jgi:hypothetical protein
MAPHGITTKFWTPYVHWDWKIAGLGKSSFLKFNLRASINDRRELLRGLMGRRRVHAEERGIYFSDYFTRLGKQYQELVNFFGGLATCKENISWQLQHNGETRQGKPLWYVSIRLTGDRCLSPFPERPPIGNLGDVKYSAISWILNS